MTDPTNAFQQRWQTVFGDAPPSDAHSYNRERYVRFYSLPKAKRWPSIREEMRVIEQRHREIAVAALGESSTCDLLVFDWGNEENYTHGRNPDDALIADLDVELAWSMLEYRDERDGEETWLHVWAVRKVWDDESFALLTRLSATDQSRYAYFNDQTQTVFCAYDGGIDVTAASTDARDSLREQFREWAAE